MSTLVRRLEHFPAKCVHGSPQKMRKIKNLERFHDSEKSESALVTVRFTPVRRALLVLTLFVPAVAGCSANLTPAADAAGPKNIILMEADGSGANSIAAAEMYTGKLGREIFEGEDWVQAWVSTYPLRTGADPVPGPDGLRQDPDSVYDPAKNWDTSPMPPLDGRYADRFAGYRWTKRTAPDSANTMSAVVTGQKTYNGAVNVDGNGAKLLSFAERERALGKSVGVVTTVEISDATPSAAGGAHNATRTAHREIAHEMFSAGVLSVIMGAGNPDFDNDGVRRTDPDFDWISDADWADLKSGAAGFALIQDRAGFDTLAAAANPPAKLAGIAHSFNATQANRSGAAPATETPFSVARKGDVPDLKTMALGALNVLGRDPDGMFLMIEGGAVDRAMHANNIGRMIEERMEFNEAVAAVAAYLDAGTQGNTWSNTLLVVTADHDHLLLGPDSDTVPYQPLVDRGAGQVPGYRWQNNSHSNQLVPLFARGQGAEMVRTCATGDDSYVDSAGRRFGRGAYLDQTQLLGIMLGNARCS
jgi:alkaline phosphatase